MKFTESVVREFLAKRQLSPSAAESGGILVGRWILDSDDVVVDTATCPLSGDRRSRASFHRSRRPHQAVLNRLWRASKGTANYLGEWHTHPEPVPSPSMVDRSGWAYQLMRPGVAAPALFFVIVGQKAIGVWEGRRGRPGTFQILPREREGGPPTRTLHPYTCR
ncbi:MAG: Mov34/MPN/PAD-1 family protein [Alphaproteobacteria bacterium]|nr:Mov34/MPN/PAD-1 family protein [Alphaproteobacteria bacterium]